MEKSKFSEYFKKSVPPLWDILCLNFGDKVVYHVRASLKMLNIGKEVNQFHVDLT